MKRLITFISVVIICFSFVSCGAESRSGSNGMPADSHVSQEIQQDTKHTDSDSDSNSISDSNFTLETDSVANNGFVPGELTYADFEVADYRGTGYHNVVDYFMANPNGTGNTFTQCGITVFYSAGDADLQGDEALAYKTPRGIGLGSSIDDVLRVYGNIAIEDFTNMEGYKLLAAGQKKISAAIYRCRIGSGACPEIRFIFDQDDKVMHISMSAVYKKFANDNVMARVLPYR